MQSSSQTPFDIEKAMPLMEAAVAPFPRAGLFALYDEGYTTLFEQLVACILSIRTLDAVMVGLSRTLFAVARTPREIAAMPLDQLRALVRSSAFSDTKAANIHAISARIVADLHGELPCDMETLLSLPGVGPKCAGLALAIACGQPHIGVDVHVHRIVNRWGLVETRSPEATLDRLKAILPRPLWVDMNRFGMPFGKFVCTASRPRCSSCPLRAMCPRIGVSASR